MLLYWICTWCMGPVSGIVANRQAASTPSDLLGDMYDHQRLYETTPYPKCNSWGSTREGHFLLIKTMTFVCIIHLLHCLYFMLEGCSRQTWLQIDIHSHQQLRILEEAQYDKQLLMPSVQNGMECRRSSCLTSALFWHCFFLCLYNLLHSTFSGTICPQTALPHASLGPITQWASVPAVGTAGMHELALGLAWEQMECEGHL